MWRVIPLEMGPAVVNMATDEAVADAVKAGISPPTIRFYRWKPSAITIGCFQCLHDEVSVAGCKEKGIDLVRRRTGGGAVYHDQAGEITYSVIAPERYFDRDIKTSYKEICSWVVEGLAIAGIKAEFRPINDIVVNNRKISGSAQTRRQGILTQHGTILFTVDRETMFSVLKPSEKKLADKDARSFKDYVTCAAEEGCPSIQLLYNALLLGFTTGKSWQPGRLNDQETESVKQLIPKYQSEEWNCSR